jgi:hypothetical protein
MMLSEDARDWDDGDALINFQIGQAVHVGVPRHFFTLQRHLVFILLDTDFPRLLRGAEVIVELGAYGVE